MVPVDASLENFNIQWELVSTGSEGDCVTSEYECKLPGKYSSRKYHMTKEVTPQKESVSSSII